MHATLTNLFSLQGVHGACLEDLLHAVLLLKGNEPDGEGRRGGRERGDEFSGRLWCMVWYELASGGMNWQAEV